MDWIIYWIMSVPGGWLFTLKSLAGLALVFGILTRLMPCNPGMYWWKSLRSALTDLTYWFLAPLIVRLGSVLMTMGTLLLLFNGKMPQPLPVKHLPIWLQCVAILLIQDVILFAIHRLFHTRLGWRFHAIHHSTKMLDWTSTARFHPVNNLLEFAVADIVVQLMGFPLTALAALAIPNMIYSAMVHANLNWTFGPFRYVLASPVFHRWHHTTEEAGLNKNFASTFPILDLVFGTFYMPAGQLPERFGNGEAHFPEGFWGQMFHPFWIGKKRPMEPADPSLRRPIPVAVKAAGILLALGVVGSGAYFGVRLVRQNRQMARALEQARLQQLQLSGAEQVVQIGMAMRSWAENDLVRATAVLDELARVFQPGTELPPQLRNLRDLCRRKCRALTGHTGAVLAVAVSSDGRRIVTGGQDGTVKVWDAATGKLETTLAGHGRAVMGVAISADGKRIVSGSHDRTIKVWNAETGQEELTLMGHTGAVLSVAISADGRRIVSGGTDWTVRVWDGATGREERTISGQTAAVLSVAISGDGKRIAWANSWAVKVGDAETGREEHVLTGHADLVYRVAISSDGKRIVSSGFDGNVKVWNPEAGREEWTLRGHTGHVYGVAISTDSKRIVSGGQDGLVKVWDAATFREELTLKGHTDAVSSVAISADGRRIASGSQDGTAKSWNAAECVRPTN